jgi:hypothetical protein
LVTPTGADVVIDSRMIQEVGVYFEDMRECDSRKKVQYFVSEPMVPPRTRTDLLTLRRGFVFGRQVRFLLFLDGPGPRCMDGTVAVAIPGKNGELKVVGKAGVRFAY